MSRLYTTHDVAKMIQVDPSTVSKWIDKNLLLAYRTPGGHRRVRLNDLRSFLVAHEMPVPDELGGGKIKLTIVDDDKTTLDGIKRSFKPYLEQVDLTTTHSGVEALLQIVEERPHGVLLDVHLPDLDGLEVCRRVRSRPALAGVSVVLFTTRWTPELEQNAKKAGATACLTKPLDVKAVLELFDVPMRLQGAA